jgi:hypothetical protein
MSAEVAKKDTLFCPRTAFEMGDLFSMFSHLPILVMRQ